MTKADQRNQSLERSIYRIPFAGPVAELPSKEVVGSKAHNLMRMAAAGLPVPPGFVIGTEVCRDYVARGSDALDGLGPVLDAELAQLAAATGRIFGDAKRPLLVSVRSGAAISMPGMMETVLNIGLNAVTMQGLIRMTGNPRLAADCRRRLAQQYGEVVGGIEPGALMRKQGELVGAQGLEDVEELDTSGLAALAEEFENIYSAELGRRFPRDPREQLRAAVEAVLRSWSSARAKTYRELNRIPETLGTAVTIQTMVFGNFGPSSGAGVGFTRNPSNGRRELFIDYLANAQGEDVVAGRRKALGSEEMQRRTLAAYNDLVAACSVLEREFRDMQDFEFTVEEGRLLLLQARSGKRTPLAALQIAHDLVSEGLIAPSEALARLDGLDLDTIEEEHLAVPDGQPPVACGTSAGAGVAIGAAVLDVDRVAAFADKKRPVILVRETAETGEIKALAAAAGLVTVEGARTSHAAVVARQLGKPCIVGSHPVLIDASLRQASFGGKIVREGDVLSIDGTAGKIYAGALDVVRERPTTLLEGLKAWQAEKPETKTTSKRRRSKLDAGGA